MNGLKAIPKQFIEPLNNRIYGDHMGPLKFGRTIDEKIDDLAARVAAVGEKNLLANGARRQGDTFVIPQQTAKTQPLEFFDINDYGKLWNPDWRLEGASRGGAGATYLDGEILVTFPRDTRPVMLERTLSIPAGTPKMVVEVGWLKFRPWRLQVFVDDENVKTQIIGREESLNVSVKEIPRNAEFAAPSWQTIELDCSKYAGKTVKVRLYHWLVPDQIPGSAYWRSIRVID
jgi:hypothetical protein